MAPKLSISGIGGIMYSVLELPVSMPVPVLVLGLRWVEVG